MLFALPGRAGRHKVGRKGASLSINNNSCFADEQTNEAQVEMEGNMKQSQVIIMYGVDLKILRG